MIKISLQFNSSKSEDNRGMCICTIDANNALTYEIGRIRD